MEIFNIILFYFTAFLLIFSTKIINSLFFAIISFVSVGFLYFLLNSEFLAVAQIAIYAIGISILLLFAIILVPHYSQKNLWIAFKPRTFLSLISILSIFGIFLLFGYEYFQSIIAENQTIQCISCIDTLRLISQNIFENYIFAFEILSILLLTSIIGIGGIIYKHKME